jgi:hypothetical protein
MQQFLLFCCFVVVLTGCKKEAATSCTPLKEAMSANNIQQVKDIITQYISQLPSAAYTEANIIQLTKKLSGECELSSGLNCFDCIMTFPSESEISIAYTSGAVTVTKTIDLTYNSANKIIFWNMHE